MDNKAYKLIFTILRNIWATLLYGGWCIAMVSAMYFAFSGNHEVLAYVLTYYFASIVIYGFLSYLIGMLTIIACGLYEVYDFNKPFFYINRGQIGDKNKLKPQDREV